MQINRHLIKAVRDILSLETIKLALVTAIPVALLWLALGWLLWDPMVALTSRIIDWVPFSLVRANGAFILTFFLWFGVVLISYALIIGLFSGLFLAQKQESKFEAINFTLIFFLALFWTFIFFANWPTINGQIEYLLTILPFQTVAKGIATLLALYIFYNLFLMSEYLVVFLFREPFLTALLEKHYPSFQSPSRLMEARPYSRLGLDLFLFFTLSILSIPLLFIPIANFLVVWFLWAWLYKESALLGVCSLFCTWEEYEKLHEERLILFATALLAGLLNFIPIISFFTPFFVMALYFHWVMERKGVGEWA
ncbi:MAG: hypothetical protein C6I00_00280 [Nitratiruptor sp.]|nr:hypothetical protein [Nitratiruptor sp.]NPA83681.1 hypothetical protein [Campylobacterota bacterium]